MMLEHEPKQPLSTIAFDKVTKQPSKWGGRGYGGGFRLSFFLAM